MYTIKPGKTLNKFYSDMNSMILSGKNKELQNNQYVNDHYSNKVKEIKALKKFQQIFQKQKAFKTKKDLQTQLRDSSPHHLTNRLRGMFFLKKKLELQEKYKELYEEEFDEDKMLEGKKIVESVPEKKKQKSKLNFVKPDKTSSGKNLQKQPNSRRPQTRLQSNICLYKKFHSQNVIDLVLVANKVKVISHQNSSFFYFNVYVEDGNNSELIKSVVRKRSGWRVVQTSNVANMIWSQFFRPVLDGRQQRKIRQIQPIKQLLPQKPMQSMIKRYDNLNKTQFIKPQNRLGGGRNHSQNKTQTLNNLKPEQYEKEVRKICPFFEYMHRKRQVQVHFNPSLHLYNHFPNHYCVSDKKNLLHNLKIFYEHRNQNVFNVIPYSIEVNRNIDFQYLREKLNEDAYWIVKPGQNSNRGRGIIVCKGTDAVIEDLKSRFETEDKEKQEKQQKISNVKQQSSPEKRQPSKFSFPKTGRRVLRKGSDETIIVQMYVQPLLYNKRKFDIRMFLLVTGVKGKIRGYLYNEGYVRTCCKIFTFDNFNKYVHLTNDAVQYKSTDYGKYEEGNKIGWKKFQNWIQSQGYGNYYPTFEKNTKKISRDVLSSVKHKLLRKQYKSSVVISEKKQIKNDSISNNTLSHSLNDVQKREDKLYYEIFGLDFLIGKNLKIWLIQINTNPALNTDCSRVVNNLIPKMIDNAFDIAVQPYTRSNKVSDTTKYQNKFEAIFDDEWDELHRIKTRRDNQ